MAQQQQKHKNTERQKTMKRHHLHKMPLNLRKSSGMQTHQWTRMAINKIKLLKEKNANIWCQNKKQTAEIQFLKKNLDAQIKASKIVVADLYRSVKQTVAYMNKLVEEKQEREEEMAMSKDVKDILMSNFATLEESFLSQSEKIRGFVDRETKLQSQLQEVEENHRRELMELLDIFNNKERENTKQLSKVQQKADEWKKKCLALKSSIQTECPENKKRKSPDESTNGPMERFDTQVHKERGTNIKRSVGAREGKGQEKERRAMKRRLVPDEQNCRRTIGFHHGTIFNCVTQSSLWTNHSTPPGTDEQHFCTSVSKNK